MEISDLLKNYRRWPGATWLKAILAGLIVGLFLKAIGLWTIIALIFGVAAFVAAVWWLHRDDPLVDPHEDPVRDAERLRTAGASGDAPIGAPPTRTHDAPAAAAPASETAKASPASEPAARPKEAAPTAETAGDSQRVRDAARAAGEAARLMSAPGDGGEAAPEGRRPATLDAARDGGADDLKKIKGVGPKLEETLHGLGVYHFDQIAGWGAAEVAWVDANLEGFPGRATRDDWVGQAKLLAGGGETEFSRRVDQGDVYDD